MDLLLNIPESESGLMIFSLASTESASKELAAASIVSSDLADRAIFNSMLIILLELSIITNQTDIRK